MKKTNTTMYALFGLAIVISAITSSLITQAADTNGAKDMDQTMLSMQEMMGSMKSMMQQCQNMMGGDMGKMMAGMGATTMPKPEGMSPEEHASHHP